MRSLEPPQDPVSDQRSDDGPDLHTDIPVPRSVDVSRRMKRYAIQMGIRVVCFVAIPFVPGVWKFVALAGAVLLPYIAVLLANDHAYDAVREAPVRPQRRAIAAGASGDAKDGLLLPPGRSGAGHDEDASEDRGEGRPRPASDDDPSEQDRS